MYEYRARLMERSNGRHPIYDGDTVWLTADLGFGVYHNIGDCRLFGIDTPELRGPEKEAGQRSRDHLRARLADVDWFTIQTEKDEQGKFGRWLVTIIHPDGTNLNKELVELELAVERSY